MNTDDNQCACLGTLHVVGWTTVDDDDKPVRPTKERYGRVERGPIRVYQTREVAARYGKPKPVYMKD